ncbi:hypothetical protein E2C01_007050 [Portunus trituberculatus]|uniref:Uncharacterized protein n=1 Tax=Portunus trituberculatus TaxID=210409 RepID=A0A5B7CWT3_PORTR|nr:hypothetical protein [Portunus trituberculatus]
MYWLGAVLVRARVRFLRGKCSEVGCPPSLDGNTLSWYRWCEAIPPSKPLEGAARQLASSKEEPISCRSPYLCQTAHLRGLDDLKMDYHMDTEEKEQDTGASQTFGRVQVRLERCCGRGVGSDMYHVVCGFQNSAIFSHRSFTAATSGVASEADLAP